MTVQVLAGYWSLNLESRELVVCPRSRQMLGLVGDAGMRVHASDWEALIHPRDLLLIEEEFEMAQRNNEIYAARFRTVSADGDQSEIFGVGRATAKNPKQFVGLNFDLMSATSIASRHSRLLPNPTSAGAANENDCQPWYASSLSKLAAATERKILANTAQSIFDDRQLRRAFLNPAMFGEAAFDALLALYMGGSSAVMTAEALSERIEASLSVTIRWLKFLASEGLVLTVEQPGNSAGSLSAALTDKGRMALDDYFRAARHLH